MTNRQETAQAVDEYGIAPVDGDQLRGLQRASVPLVEKTDYPMIAKMQELSVFEVLNNSQCAVIQEGCDAFFGAVITYDALKELGQELISLADVMQREAAAND